MYRSILVALLSALPLALSTPTPTAEDGASALEARSCARGIGPAASSLVVKRFKQSGVVPTLVPALKPQVLVGADYNGKKVILGNKFTTEETAMEPVLTFDAEPGYPLKSTNYSVFMIDPDVPNPQSPARMTFLHWYFAHAKPKCVKGQTPDTVTVYESPSPASKQQHRYTFLVFREPAGYQPDVGTAQIRPGFDIDSYASAGHLTLIGGNFFLESILNT